MSIAGTTGIQLAIRARDRKTIGKYVKLTASSIAISFRRRSEGVVDMAVAKESERGVRLSAALASRARRYASLCLTVVLEQVDFGRGRGANDFACEVQAVRTQNF